MRRKRRRQGEVELNLAAMLDMAFQLLTFFILTFKPAPVEGQVLLRLPPPEPVTGKVSGQRSGSEKDNPNPLQALDTLVISALAHSDGSLNQMSVGGSADGGTPVGGLSALDQKLGELLNDPGTGFKQVIIQVDSRLRYEELMRIIDVCTRQKLPSGEPLTKLSFVELPPG